MLVKLLCSRSCAVAGPQNFGDVVEIDDDEAGRLVASGQAEPVKATAKRGAKKVETAKKRAPRKEKRG